MQVWRLECQGDRLAEQQPLHQWEACCVPDQSERGQVHKKEEQMATEGEHSNHDHMPVCLLCCTSNLVVWWYPDTASMPAVTYLCLPV